MTQLLLMCLIAGRRAAIPTSRVLSVIEIEAVTPIPLTPDFIVGLTALRSQALTVIDCRVSLGFEPSAGVIGSRAAVIEHEGHRYALLVDEAFDVADAARLVLAEGFMWRHTPQARRFVEALPRIGKLRTVRATFSFTLASDADVRLNRELAGGSLMDVGTYCVSAARLIVGREPAAALGLAWPAPSGVDERFSGILDFGDGVVATLTSGFRSDHAGIEVIGSAGSLRLDDPFQGRATTLVGSDGLCEEIARVDPYEIELDDFAAAIRGERRALLGRADALGQARALAALYQSAASGAVVPVAP